MGAARQESCHTSPFSAHSDKAWSCHALLTLALVFLIQRGLLRYCSLTSPSTKRNSVTILTKLNRSFLDLRSYYRAFMEYKYTPATNFWRKNLLNFNLGHYFCKEWKLCLPLAFYYSRSLSDPFFYVKKA